MNHYPFVGVCARPKGKGVHEKWWVSDAKSLLNGLQHMRL